MLRTRDVIVGEDWYVVEASTTEKEVVINTLFEPIVDSVIEVDDIYSVVKVEEDGTATCLDPVDLPEDVYDAIIREFTEV